MAANNTELAELLAAFHEDIPAFFKVMFGFELRAFQVEFAEAFRTRKLITFKGGAGPGKTFTMAGLTWWALITHNNVKIIHLGPNEAQIKQGLWNELGMFHERMKEHAPWFHSQYDYTATKIERRSNPASCSARFMLADKDNTAKVRGIHADNTFVFVDEASGVDDAVLDALYNTTMDANSRLCLISNPDRTDGYFYETWENPEIAADWHHLTATMRDDPNKSEEDIARFARNAGGVTSRKYRVMVLGDFPIDSDDSMISALHVEDAISNTECEDPNASIIWGLDVAGGGKDSTVLIQRQGAVVGSPRSWNYADTEQTAFAVYDLYNSLPTRQRPVEICVDAIGIGAGVFNCLKHKGLPVKAVKVSNVPTRRVDEFERLRDQLWWMLKEWLEAGVCRLPDHQALRKEICLPRYEHRNGKIKVESKDELKRRGRKSPDFADALCLTFAGSHSSKFTGRYSWDKPIKYKRAHLS